jgi:hypothetical protein
MMDNDTSIKKKKPKKYYIDTDYCYNSLGADERLVVFLVYGTKDKYKTVNSWEYSTFLSNTLAHNRAERKIRKLKTTYGAKFI